MQSHESSLLHLPVENYNPKIYYSHKENNDIGMRMRPTSQYWYNDTKLRANDELNYDKSNRWMTKDCRNVFTK